MVRGRTNRSGPGSTGSSTPRLLHRASFGILAAVGALVLMAPQAFAAISFSGVPSGTAGRVSNWAWDNGDPAIGGGSNGNISTIFTSDSIGSECFSGAFGGTSQLAVFYSKLASGGSAWGKPVRVSGSGNGDRGTLVTNGSNAYLAYSTQAKYYSLLNGHCNTYNFSTADPRIVYFRKSTDNGSTWSTAVKLPGQSATFRGDYNYMASSGTNVYVTTTDVSNGHILLWVSTNSGGTFGTPLTIGTTTNKDTVPGQTNGACPCGYVGGYSGLPAIATDGSAIGIAYTATATGAEKIAICSTTGTGCATSTVASSGANANAGYSQAAGASGRMVFTWTTPSGAFSDLWTGGTAGSFGGVKTITSFPDSNFAGTACQSATGACNVAGSGAIPVLLGSTGVGISLTECNSVSGAKCDETQTVEKSREILVWYESSNNGGSYGTHALIQAPTSAKNTYMEEFGSIANIGGKPYVLISQHDDIYSAYQVSVRSCTGC